MTDPTPPAPPAEPPADPTTPPATGDGLGEAGKKALQEEREARKALEREIKALKERDPVKELLAKLGQEPATGDDPAKALQDRIDAMERRAAEAEAKALRAEVASEKGLTAAQAKRLQGSTRKELEADADDLLASFPKAAGTPRPDPTQGARSGGAPGMLTVEDVKRLAKEGKHDEIEKARAEGRIDYESARKR